MSTVIEQLEAATSGVQFVVGQIANAISPQAKAIADFILGQPSLLASWADLVQKTDDGTATWEDIVEPVLKLESMLAATALLAATPGAQPAATILGAVAASLFVWKQRGLIANADATVKSYLENRYAQLENSIRAEFGLPRIFEPPVIDFTVNTSTTAAINLVRRDPLVLDLDGGGIATSAIDPNAPILFDANGDAIKTGTAWAGADDAMLVRDLNGNGQIDSGQELFGDETLLANGQKAAHGFAALSELDSNADSQADELQGLDASGVQGINLTSTASNINRGDAILTQSGSFTRTGGGSGQAGSFILAQNNFTTSFEPIAVSDAARALPNLGGSGWVRGLQEAATESPELIALVDLAKNAPTRADYKDAVENLMREWGNDSAYDSASKQALAAGYGLILSEPQDEKERGWMDSAIKASELDRNTYRANLAA